MTTALRLARTPAEEGLLAAFENAGPRLPGLAEARAAAITAFAARGLPHRRVEAWKYSDLRAALREALPLASAPDAATLEAARAFPAAFAGFEAVSCVFVNGRFVPALSHGAPPKGVQLRPLEDALAHGDRLVEAHLSRLHDAGGDSAVALNTAFVQGGAIVHVDAGTKAALPLHLDFRFVGAPASVYPRLLVVVGDGAEVMLVESHRGPGGVAYQTNAVTEIVLGKGARLTHLKLQAQGREALHISHAFLEMAAEANYDAFALEEGAAFARRGVHLRFAGEGATARLNGATLATARQHLDTTLEIDHAVPRCESREVFKYVLAGEARGVFQGKIVVRPDAQKTDGRLSARGLLLNEGAEFDAKPELEIYADDVQCAHGATAGELDEDLMFYLRARGIPEGEAKALLVTAFIGEALEAVENDAVREAIGARIEAWLAANL